MINNFEQVMIQKIDELALYLEITKYQAMLVNLRNDMMMNPSFENIGIQREIIVKERIKSLLESTERFGIDSTNKEKLNKWMDECYSYMNNLDVVELLKFTYMKVEGTNLGLLGTSRYTESTFLKSEKVKKQRIS